MHTAEHSIRYLPIPHKHDSTCGPPNFVPQPDDAARETCRGARSACIRPAQWTWRQVRCMLPCCLLPSRRSRALHARLCWQHAWRTMPHGWHVVYKPLTWSADITQPTPTLESIGYPRPERASQDPFVHISLQLNLCPAAHLHSSACRINSASHLQQGTSGVTLTLALISIHTQY